MTIDLQPSVVYGPIRSRRLGISLGINILPTDRKFCLSNCIYCQYGPTDPAALGRSKLPRAGQLLEEIEKEFARHRDEGLRPDSLTICGNGEPTLHPDLARIVDQVIRLRSRYFKKARLGILSDSSRVHVAAVREVLSRIEDRCMKLDTGDPEMYRAVNQPFGDADWERMVEGLCRLPGIVLQSLFLSAPVNNAEGPSFERWLEAVKRIGPKRVHVYTIDRPPASAEVKAAPRERLEAVAGRIRHDLGIEAMVF